MIVVTGASGNLGGRIARMLLERGHAVRTVSRSAAAPGWGGEHARAAFEDREAMDRALRGAEGVFLVSLPEGATRIAKHACAIDAAVGAGVRRIVYASFLGAAADARLPQAQWHAHTEAHLRSCGVPSTILRAGLFARSLASTAGYLEGSVLRAPAGSGRVAPVDERDLAETAVAALLDASPASRVLDVTGPELVSWSDIAAAMSPTPHEHTYEPCSPGELADRLRAAGRPPHLVDGILALFDDIREHKLAVRSRVTRDVAGCAPTTIRESFDALYPSRAPCGRTLVRRFVDACNAGDVEGVGAQVSEGYRQHNPMVAQGRAGLREGLRSFRAAFSGLRATLLDMTEEGDTVAARTRWEGVHVGDFAGITATGRTLSWTAMDFWRVEAGLLTEHWDEIDLAGLVRAMQ